LLEDPASFFLIVYILRIDDLPESENFWKPPPKIKIIMDAHFYLQIYFADKYKKGFRYSQ